MNPAQIPTVALNTRVPLELRSALMTRALRENCSVNALVNYILSEALNIGESQFSAEEIRKSL